jgi:hypothetical protein
MPSTTSNLGLTLPTPNVDTGWGGTLNTDFTIIDSIFSSTGTAVSMNVGSGKTLAVSGTLLLGSGDGTSSLDTPTIRGPAAVGTNIAGPTIIVKAANGTGTGGSGDIRFQTAPAGTSGSTANTFQNILSLNSNGRVGILTANPEDDLELKTSTAVNTFVRVTNTIASAQFGIQASGSARLFNKGNYDLKFGTNDIERFSIGSAGQFGIGTTPSYGTSGQVLTSAGSGAAPTWETPASTGITAPASVNLAGAVNGTITGISVNAKIIFLVLNRIRVSNTEDILIQVGSSSIDTTSYTSYSASYGSGNASATGTTGFIVKSGSTSADITGTVTLSNITGNLWDCSYSLVDTGQNRSIVGGGFRTVSGGALQRVRITTSGGATFDNGDIRVMYLT